MRASSCIKYTKNSMKHHWLFQNTKSIKKQKIPFSRFKNPMHLATFKPCMKQQNAIKKLRNKTQESTYSGSKTSAKNNRCGWVAFSLSECSQRFTFGVLATFRTGKLNWRKFLRKI